MHPLRPALRFASLLLALTASATAALPNVLLIISDDLRPQLGAYGDTLARTPHLDRFAQSALRFDRAYVQQAVCSPSRNSFLSGLRPGTTGLRGFGRTLRSAVPDVITLPQHFKQHGYHAEAMGKVFHVYAETGLGSENDPESWSVPAWLPTKASWGPQQEAQRQQAIAAARAAGKELRHSRDWPRGEAVDDPDVPDDELRDGETAARAAAFLLARQGARTAAVLPRGRLLPAAPAFRRAEKVFRSPRPDRAAAARRDAAGGRAGQYLQSRHDAGFRALPGARAAGPGLQAPLPPGLPR